MSSEDGEQDLGNPDKQLEARKDLTNSLEQALRSKLPFEKAFNDSDIGGFSFNVTGTREFSQTERFKSLAREVYEEIVNEHNIKKKEGMWSAFSSSLKDRWAESTNRIKADALKLLSSPEINRVRDELWQKVEEKYVANDAIVIDIGPVESEIDPLLSEAQVELEGTPAAVNAEEFWDQYRDTVGKTPPNKTTVALEVIPTIQNDNLRGLQFAHPRNPGVVEYFDNDLPVSPAIVIGDATNPNPNFMGGKSNRTAGIKNSNTDAESHYFSASDREPSDKEKHLLSNKCTFGEGSGGELVMSVPVKLNNEYKPVYVSYLVTRVKFIISDEIDDRTVPSSVRPVF